MAKEKARKIIHLDLDAFFCAVEELHDPSLAGKPFAVGGKPGQRGVISSCSYAARMKGIHSAMPTGQALQKCPGLILLSSHHANYEEKSNEVMAILRKLSPLVEQISVDEAFIDITDLPDEGRAIAERLQKEVAEKTGLPCSIGVAMNKLVAKIATDIGKARNTSDTYPRSILVIPQGSEAQFLAPLPVKAMWGVGPKTEARLNQLGIFTLGELAERLEDGMERQLGKYGRELVQRARGIDHRPVVVEHEVKSISQERTFAEDTTDILSIRSRLHELASRVGYQMRCDGVRARVIRIKLRWSDFSTCTRQMALNQPTDQDAIIAQTADLLLSKIWDAERPVRLIGVGGSGLVQGAQQMSLWDTEEDKEHRLLEALDALHEKFGIHSVQKATRIQPKEDDRK